MPPHPSHRLSAWLVPTDPDRRCPVGLADGLAVLSTARGARVGQEWVPGGWAAARLDRPPQPHLYGNKQGGFQVQCPGCHGALVREVTRALTRWRRGEGRALRCPACGLDTVIERLDYRPPAAPANFAIELRDLHGLTLTSAGRARFTDLLGGDFQVIGSRG